MDATIETDSGRIRRGGRRTWGQILGWAALAGVIATGLAQLSTTEALRLLGLPDPGPVTTYGLPALMAFGEVSAVVMVGCLLLAAVLVPPQRSGVLDVDGYLAVRTAGTAALVWAGCALLLVPLSLSDSSGQPLPVVFANPGTFLRAVVDVDVSTAWAWTALLASAVATLCRLVLRHKWTPALLVLALIALMPRALSGHSAAGGSHDIATNSLVLHLVAAALWAGGLAALVLHARRRGGHLDVAARRFSAIALAAFVVMALSGLVNAAVRVPPSAWVTSTYGVLVLAKVAALVVVGVAGWRQRTVAVAALQVDPTDRREFVRLAAVETVVLAAAIGIAVALGRTPPPAPSERREPSIVEETLGYALGGPPTGLRVVWDWRFDLLFGTAAILLAAVYLLAVRKLRRAGVAWPAARTAWWLAGCLVVLLATSSGIGRFAPAVFSVHLVAVTSLAILAPLCLVLGAPVTLLRTAMPAAASSSSEVPGVRHWLGELAASAPLRALTRPVAVTILFSGAFYLYYFGGLFETYSGSHVVHVLANAYFLASGVLLFAVTVGPDRFPRQPMSRRAAVIVLVIAAAAFVSFAAVVASTDVVIAEQYYTMLQRGWFDDLAADQRGGGLLALAIGVPCFAVALAHVMWLGTRSLSPLPRTQPTASE